ncbi:hypothetical protein MNBD_GAMMA22-1442 [hydrothermal vent metagenome]|uniref:Uncharacterized protein n=1 Tax=hydrothermal vent metagenome TaxID=652676 RepID=A0A3B1A4Y5_9ZZZZ
MKSIFRTFYLSLPLMLLAGCGGGSSDNNTTVAATQTMLEGAWQSPCFQGNNGYEININTFTNENNVNTVNAYDDSACLNNVLTLTVKAVFSVAGSKTLTTGETVNDLDIIFESAVIKLKTNATVTFFNADTILNCNGTKTYVLNQEVDVSTCTYITDMVTIGSKQYAIFFIDQNKLYSSGFADSDALRPIAIDYTPSNIVTKL